MTEPNSEPRPSTTLVFQAPPSRPDDDLDTEYDDVPFADLRGDAPPDSWPTKPGRQSEASRGRPVSGSSTSDGPLRMLKGARQAAAGMNITDDEIRAVLEDPEDAEPDPNQPQRTRLRRDGLVVTTGNDGMILRVTRKR